MPRAKKTPTAKPSEAEAKATRSDNSAISGGANLAQPGVSAARSAAAKANEAPGKAVTSVNPEAGRSGAAKANGDLEGAIRARAYQIYEERGRKDGFAQEDWVRAEREILSQHEKRTA